MRRTHGVSVRSTNRFDSDRNTSTWQVTRNDNDKALSVAARFPSYGSKATVTAVTASGTRISLKRGSRPIALHKIAYLWLRSAGNETGYVVVPLSFPAGAGTAVVRPGQQSSAPDPGPTLVLELISQDRKFDSCTLKVAIGVADSSATAASVARKLGA